MRKVCMFSRHDYLTNLRRTGFIIWTLMVPLLGLLGLLVAAFFGGQAASFFERQFMPEQSLIGYVDQSGMFTPALPEYADHFFAYADQQAGEADLVAGEIDTLLIIPADYLETGRVAVITRSGFAIGASEDAENFLTEHLLNGNIDPVIGARVLAPIDPELVTLSAEGAEGVSSGGGVGGMILGFMVPYILGVMLAVTIFSSSGYLLRSVSEEKTSRVIEILLSSVSARELLAGKVIGLGALGLTQIAFWLGSAVLLSGGTVGLLGVAIPLFTKPQIFILSFVYYLLGFTLFAVLMATAGSLGTTEQEAQQIGGMFSLFATFPMMIIGFVFSNPNATIARVLSWIPLTAPTMMMMRMTLGELPVIDIIGSIAVCLVSIPAAVWLGAKVFRTGLLMYGKRLSIREIVRLLRAA